LEAGESRAEDRIADSRVETNFMVPWTGRAVKQKKSKIMDDEEKRFLFLFIAKDEVSRIKSGINDIS
jgi:hypothetical protein